nr:hypothetical protein [Bacilli bacterium]
MKKSRFIKEQKGALGGFVPDLIAGIIAAYGLDLLLGIFSMLLKSFIATVTIVNLAHAYSTTLNGIDPATNVGYATEAAQAFGNTLPVANAGSDVVSVPPTLGQETSPGDLALYLGGDPGNAGYDQLTVDYALELPISIPTWTGGTWTSVQPQPMQLYYTLTFYQIW